MGLELFEELADVLCDVLDVRDQLFDVTLLFNDGYNIGLCGFVFEERS